MLKLQINFNMFVYLMKCLELNEVPNNPLLNNSLRFFVFDLYFQKLYIFHIFFFRKIAHIRTNFDNN